MDSLEEVMHSLEELMQIVQKGLLDGEPLIVGIVVAVIVVFLTIVILACGGGSNKRRGVAMVGICGGGKTLIFTRLVHKRFVETVTSMKENIGTYDVKEKGKQLTLIDLPGHERSRSKHIDTHKSMARGVMFVIDSLTFQKEIKDVAEFVYTLLTDRVMNSAAPPVLFVCNKQDQMLAKGAKVIQAQLEKEMNTVRVTRSAALESTDGSSNSSIFLGKRDRDFSFNDLKSFKVTFCEASAKKNGGDDADLSAVEEWLLKLA